MHEATYFHCDWTGQPMRASNCYMPVWSSDGSRTKVAKHGSYCNWESVVAHAAELYETSQPELYERIYEYVAELTGTKVVRAPHWSRLAWFAKDDQDTLPTIRAFQALCESDLPISIIVIEPDGKTIEQTVSQKEAQANFAQAIGLHASEIATFVTTRKKVKDQEICVFHSMPTHGLPENPTATAMLKINMRGRVVLAMRTKELCFVERLRYKTFTLEQLSTIFGSKKRTRESMQSMTADDYAAQRVHMESTLTAVEQYAAASASAPSQLAMGAILPVATGKEIAHLARLVEACA